MDSILLSLFFPEIENLIFLNLFSEEISCEERRRNAGAAEDIGIRSAEKWFQQSQVVSLPLN